VPTYEYQCSDCSATIERWQRFNDAPLTLCPTCGGSLRRVFSAVGIIFKGSGWYCTDNRSNGRSESESDSGASKSTSTAAA